MNHRFDGRYDTITIERSKALMDLVKSDHPGAALLAELDAARAAIAFVGPNADCPTSALNQELTRLLLAYDKAVKTP